MVFHKHRAEREAEKEAQKYRAALSNWQTQHERYANLVEVAEGFDGSSTDEIMLKPEEALFYQVINCALVEERRGKGTYQGGSTGVSIPIGSLGGRSVRYRVGASRGHYVQGAPVATAIDIGTAYITDQRVVFAGNNQTRECLFVKMIGVSHDDASGETTISMSNRQKPTVIHYGPQIAGEVDFRLELAVAHFKGTVPHLVTQMRVQLAQIDAERPGGPAAGASIAPAPPSGATSSASSIPLAAAPELPLVEPADRDAGWEYLYLASELARGLDACAPQYARYQSQATDPPGEPVADPGGYVKVLGDQILGVVTSGVDHAVAPDVFEHAVGKPGEPGDEAAIRALAAELTGVYAAMISWGIAVRSVAVDPKWRPAYAALAKYVSLPLHQFQDFSAEFSATMGGAIGDIRAGKPQGEEFDFTLKLSVDPTAEAEFDAALAAVQAGG